MVKRIKRVTKNKNTRERKKLIVVGTEGNNKTEIQYLRNLEKDQKQYHFIFAQGNETDPVKIVNNTLKRSKQEKLKFKSGDLAVSMFDLDLDESKIKQLKEAKEHSLNGNICIISSNPCFEIWYLEHFGYTSKAFNSSSELIRCLKKKIPGYHKNQCDYKLLQSHTDEAIMNCKRLDEYHKKNGKNSPFEFNNPRTDVYKLVEVILQKKKPE